MEEIIVEIKEDKKYKDLLEESTEGKEVDAVLLGELCDLIKIKLKDSLMLNTVIDIFIEDNEKNKDESNSFKTDIQNLLHYEVTGLFRAMLNEPEYKCHLYKINALNNTLTQICSRNTQINNKEDAINNKLFKDMDEVYKNYLQKDKVLSKKVTEIVDKHVPEEKKDDSEKELYLLLATEIVGSLGVKEQMRKEMEKCIIL
jgi:hypothetical protein